MCTEWNKQQIIITIKQSHQNNLAITQSTKNHDYRGYQNGYKKLIPDKQHFSYQHYIYTPAC